MAEVCPVPKPAIKFEQDDVELFSSTKLLFFGYQREIDSYHDRIQSVSKISRDILMEAKRIIFLLHRCATEPNNKVQLINESSTRLLGLRNLFFDLGKVVGGYNRLRYFQLVSSALQEYIEAWSFHVYLSSKTLLDINDVMKAMIFQSESAENGMEERSGRVYLEVSCIDYLLGICDLGGELMRYGISQSDTDAIDRVQHVRDFMLSLYSEIIGVQSMFTGNTELSKKLEVFHECLTKVEQAWYKARLKAVDVRSLRE